jgi:hypothetical protein
MMYFLLCPTLVFPSYLPSVYFRQTEWEALLCLQTLSGHSAASETQVPYSLDVGYGYSLLCWQRIMQATGKMSDARQIEIYNRYSSHSSIPADDFLSRARFDSRISSVQVLAPFICPQRHIERRLYDYIHNKNTTLRSTLPYRLRSGGTSSVTSGVDA